MKTIETTTYHTFPNAAERCSVCGVHAKSGEALEPTCPVPSNDQRNTRRIMEKWSPLLKLLADGGYQRVVPHQLWAEICTQLRELGRSHAADALEACPPMKPATMHPTAQAVLDATSFGDAMVARIAWVHAGCPTFVGPGSEPEPPAKGVDNAFEETKVCRNDGATVAGCDRCTLGLEADAIKEETPRERLKRGLIRSRDAVAKWPDEVRQAISTARVFNVPPPTLEDGWYLARPKHATKFVHVMFVNGRCPGGFPASDYEIHHRLVDKTDEWIPCGP